MVYETTILSFPSIKFDYPRFQTRVKPFLSFPLLSFSFPPFTFLYFPFHFWIQTLCKTHSQSKWLISRLFRFFIQFLFGSRKNVTKTSKFFFFVGKLLMNLIVSCHGLLAHPMTSSKVLKMTVFSLSTERLHFFKIYIEGMLISGEVGEVIWLSSFLCSSYKKCHLFEMINVSLLVFI